MRRKELIKNGAAELWIPIDQYASLNMLACDELLQNIFSRLWWAIAPLWQSCMVDYRVLIPSQKKSPIPYSTELYTHTVPTYSGVMLQIQLKRSPKVRQINKRQA